MDFLIYSEIPEREIRSLLLIQEELRRRGYSVRIVTAGCKEHYNDVKVLVTNTLLTTRECVYAVLPYANKPKKIVDLCWEQAREKRAQQRRFNRMCETAKSFNYLCWGENDTYDEVLERVINPNRVWVTGPIHFDFLRPQFEEIYETRYPFLERFGINPNKKVILFVSSFGLINPSKDRIESAIFNQGEELYNRTRQFEERTHQILLDWFERLLNEQDDYVVVYRTHPRMGESDRVKELAKEMEGFYWITDETLQQWMSVSDYVATVESTSITESYTLGKNTMILRPIQLDQDMDCELYEGIDGIDSYDDFKARLDRFEKIKPSYMDKIYDIKERASYMRSCDALEEIYKNDEYNVIWGDIEKNEIKEYRKKQPKELLYRIFLKVFKKEKTANVEINKNIKGIDVEALRKQISSIVNK